MTKAAAIRRPAALLAAALLAGCEPDLAAIPKGESHAPAATQATPLGQAVSRRGDPADGRGGFYILADGPEALAARLALADRATRSIDAQYYLLHDDEAGHLYAWTLLKAADRGVRVRLLLDDIDTAHYDAIMVALDRHPNFEIRLWNPFSRQAKLITSAFQFARVNRRMHNKSMTFDNQITIVGGRNIGSEYFAAREDSNYDDLDVLGAGPVARDVSANFDAYWNSRWAVPVSAVTESDLSLDAARQRLGELARTAAEGPYGSALRHRFGSMIDGSRVALTWAPYKVISDPPEKAAGLADDLPILASVARPYIDAATSELQVVSAYFVPRRRGVGMFRDLEARGVDVTILTNSMDSTDVAPVHGHYAHSRKDLLRAGVDLWELLPDKARPDRDELRLGHSQSSLHAKAFAVDRRYLFIGSFNWDPRSVLINTEMGILLDSPVLADRAVRRLQAALPETAFHLRLSDKGRVEWLEPRGPGSVALHRSEPSQSAWTAFLTGLYGLLPIGGQL